MRSAIYIWFAARGMSKLATSISIYDEQVMVSSMQVRGGGWMIQTQRC